MTEREKTPIDKRDKCVDIIKGWAILTIIIFHCSQKCFTGFVGSLLGCSWDVPVFFVVGGFFLKEEVLNRPITFLKGKFKRLYLPATIIYAICILLHNVFVKIGWYPLGGHHSFTGAPFTLYGWKETGIGLAKVLLAGGSGELVMGAMWFIYSLLYAFVGMSLIYWLIGLFCKNKEIKFFSMTVCLLLLAVLSCVLSQNYAFTISRFSTAMTAMFLIWWGMIINKKWQWKFNAWWGFAISVIVFVHCVIMQKGAMVLARNEYQDLVQLTVGCTVAIYIWGFIGKKIENCWIGKFLALLGRESLYLMAFHIIGFFICNSLLVCLGVFRVGEERFLYTYVIGNNYLLLLLYVFFGVTTSFALLYEYRGIKKWLFER